MSSLTRWLSLAAVLVLAMPGAARAQYASDAPVQPPDAASLRTEPQAPLTQEEGQLPPAAAPVAQEPETNGAILDGHLRYGAFLSGPGSLTFILHHSLMGALGGFFTQGIANGFSLERSSREAMLAGTLIGAGLGFGSSAWWQFYNWVDKPMGYFGIGNSVMGGMFAAGFMDMLTRDASALAWAAFLGAELGAWLTATIAGGQLPLDDGMLVASGGGWGLIYGALLLAIVHFSGTKISGQTWADSLLMAPALGATALAVATMKYNPTPAQILRADLFGVGVGGVVLLLSGLVLGGFDQPTPYVLSFLGSAAAITTVSLLWEEAAERPSMGVRSTGRSKAYRCVWW
ncbi:hypothetical protein [Archangium lansingense]|uniref:Ammonium transporter AmtB-like domain-containing protein n=1 Tax=Archangium lansingense TaxID=2995310 RepID=A0ABT4A7V8_9BACT|nr:hypothetical protein [Archangium lansinium]MCY1077681.1 hypothetical protein [Archangium lansinium]